MFYSKLLFAYVQKFHNNSTIIFKKNTSLQQSLWIGGHWQMLAINIKANKRIKYPKEK